jgi:hypothetical protein
MIGSETPYDPEQVEELFRKLRLCAPAWIDMPLDGISEAADMAEEYVRRYPQLFWNTPPRQSTSEDAFVSIAINRLKSASLKTGRHASQLIAFLEARNAK